MGQLDSNPASKQRATTPACRLLPWDCQDIWLAATWEGRLSPGARSVLVSLPLFSCGHPAPQAGNLEAARHRAESPACPSSTSAGTIALEHSSRPSEATLIFKVTAVTEVTSSLGAARPTATLDCGHVT